MAPSIPASVEGNREIGSLREAKAQTLDAYTSIHTLGYDTAGDGGGAIYVRGNGSECGAWQDAAGHWFAPGKQALDVRMFGAKFNWDGDDTTATNDADAIQTALNCAAASFAGGNDVGGGAGAVVTAPAGTSLVSHTIRVPDQVTLRGQGTMTTIMKMISTFKPSDHFIILGNPNHLAAFGSRLEDLQLFSSQMNGLADTAMVYTDNAQHTGGLKSVKIFAGNRIAAWFQIGYGGASYFTFEDVETFNHGNTGITNNPQIRLNYAGLASPLRNIVVQGPPTGGSAARGIEILGGFVTIDTLHIESVAEGVMISIPDANHGSVSIQNYVGGAGVERLIHIDSNVDAGTVSLKQIYQNGGGHTLQNDPAATIVDGNIIAETLY